jgi:hypothetical protein
MKTLPSQISQQYSRVDERGFTGGNTYGLERVYEVDPLQDDRWQSFLQRHPQSSIYHSVGWLDSLSRTYGYEPVVYTTSPATSDIENGLLFCRIRSWATGHRLVSLPFSDHCEPLCNLEEEFDSLICHLQTDGAHQKWKYLEVRPAHRSFGDKMDKRGFKLAAKYVWHRIDLDPAAEEIFHRLDKDSVQRRVRHAERLGVVESCGKSVGLLRDFYRLQLRTRARHNLPPQPFAWFKNLLDNTGKAADLRVAYVRNVPVAAVFVLHFKNTSHYKYGCSDERFHKLGAMAFLLWRAILNAKSIGSKVFDLGRTEDDQHSLIAFKNHWTPISESLTYWKFPFNMSANFDNSWKLKMLNRICAQMPHRLLEAVGTLTYRHVG